MSGCRAWYPTAFHTATALGPDESGRPRVLVTGGITVDAGGLVHNPDQGPACAPNAFTLTVDPESAQALLQPVVATPEAAPAAKRALHSAVRIGGRVLISGGWASSATPTALEAGQQVLLYDDSTGTLDVAPFQLSEPRLGHVLAPLPHDGALIAGGASRADGVLGLTHTATVYTAPLGPGTCAPPAPAATEE